MIFSSRNLFVRPFGIVNDVFIATKAKPITVEERLPHVILADFSLEILVDKGKLRKISSAKHVVLERNSNRAFTICCAMSSIACSAFCTRGAEETI